MTLYESFWVNGLEPELTLFFNGLNWFYIIMFIVVLHGLKHTNELSWYDKFCKLIKADDFSKWIAAILIAGIFCFFRWQEGGIIDAANFSSMLRSIFFAVIFSGIFVDIPVAVIKKLGKVIDIKGEKD